MVEKGNTMLRKITAIAGLALFAQLAHAAEAGKVIFAAGQAHIVDRPVVEGAAVQEGDLLQTGPDGFLYIKTLDNGLFILRPNTKARIVAYHIDAKQPANTRIKLDLISGVARSKSGDAVKQARQNFRFNTPVAAIGVRGTDFTVFTDEDTSRVSVISGGVVVSGFAGGCRPEGNGPCEGAASRELSAAQRGQLLQIKRGSSAPQLMEGGAVAPDQPVAPGGAPLVGATTGGGASIGVVPQPSLDIKKTESLEQANSQKPPPVVVPPIMPPPVVSTPELPDRQILWGRWQPLKGQMATVSLKNQKAELVALNGNFALLRTAGKDFVAPERGEVGFALKGSEAYVYSDYGASRLVAPAQISNGKLNVNFGTRTFLTSFDLASKSEVFKFQSQGNVSADGRLYGDAANSRTGYLDLQGLLSADKGGSAAYIFNGRIDSIRTVNGVTYWQQ